MTIRRHAAPIAATVALATVVVAFPAAARTTGDRCGAEPLRRAAATWAPPLDRPVRVRIGGVPLRDALARVAQQAGIRLTYVADLLPLDQPVCLPAERVPAGQLLSALLTGTPLAPVAAGADQVVLAPTSDEARQRARDALRIGTLDRMIVTGARGRQELPPSPIATDVISGRDLEARGATTLAGALDGIVPGLWIWNAAPGAATTRLASLRGASSFGAAAPKIYVDGIEVANPMILAQLRAESIDQIEVIRGPQGGALFGADAIGGVLQITTRHTADAGDTPRAQVSMLTGLAAADGTPRGVPLVDQAVTLRVGAPTRAAGLHLSRATLGEYQPQAASSQWSAAGDLTLVGTRRSLVAQARLFSMEANHPTPLLAAARTGATTTPPTRFTPSRAVFPWGEPADSARRDRLGNAMLPPTSIPSGPQNDAASTAPQSVHQYTIGAVATAVTTDGWTSRLTVGLDGYRLTNPIADPGLLGSAADSALRAASGAADRLTLRASTTRSTSIATAGTASLTLTADHSTLREATTSATVGAPAPTTPPADAILRHSTGAIARADLAWRATRLTAGARLEQNRGFSTLPQLSLLPTLAASHTRQVGPVTATARAAWGEAIRPPRLAAMRLGSTQAMRLMIDAALAPERQAGTELGLDLTWGPHLAVGLTRFDQRATGLLQAATVTAELAPWRSTSARRLMTAVQNVGEITNHGWEATATARRGALTLTGALGTVQSTVSQVSPGYLGDLRAGDRMLDVPRYTAGLTASWTAARWSASIGGARAGQWIGYDRAAMAADLASGRRTPEQIAGGALRAYWREYDAISRLRTAFTRELGRRLTLTLTGDNLLDVRRGEPDNLTVLPGRTIAAGLRARL